MTADGVPRDSGSCVRVSRAWWALLGLAIALRLAMGADRDILAVNQPYDDYWFVSTASHGIWHGRYDQMAFAQLQLFAMWLKLVNVFGIPARLAIDLAWLGSAVYTAAAVVRLCRRTWPGALVFAFLAFHPFSLVLFDRALSENLMACLTAVAIAAFIDVWNFREDGPRPSRRQRRLALLTAGIAFAAAYHCRKEGLLMWFPLLMLLAATLVDRARWWRGGIRSRAVATFAVPIGTTVLCGAALAGANAAHTGVFARYELAAPNYQRAIHALTAIAPSRPTPRFVTITAATRAAAYEVSPTFRELRAFFDGPASAQLTATTEMYTGAKGEIGNGWFYWTLRDAAATAGWHRTALEAERKYAAMSDEIERAFDDGRLAYRAAPMPFIDPDWRKWVPDLPAALITEWTQTVVPTPQSMYRLGEDANLSEKDVYTRITGRRRPFDYARISAWITAPEGTRIGIVTDDELGARVVLSGSTRPDVPGAYQFQVEAPGYTEFTKLVIDRPDHARTVVLFSALEEDRVTPLAPGLILGVDRLAPRPKPPWANRALPGLIGAWSIAGWLFMAAGVGGVAVALARRPSVDVLAVILVIAFVTIASRVGMLAILDTTSWSGGSRYLLPVVPFVALLGPLGLCAMLDAARLKGRRHAG